MKLWRWLVFSLTLLLLFASVQVEAKKKKKRKKKKRAEGSKPQAAVKKEVSITRRHLCLGCQSFVEDYHRAVKVLLKKGQKKVAAGEIDLAPRALQNEEISGIAIYNKVKDDYFSKYNQDVQYACEKLGTEHWDDLVKPMAGVFHASAANERGVVMQRKRQLCSSVPILACHPGVFVEPFAVEPFAVESKDKKEKKKNKKKVTQCDACRSIVKDIDFLVERLDSKQATSRSALTTTLEGVCNDISMRHEMHVSFLEESCEDLFDEHQQGIIDTVNMHEKLSRAGFTPDQSLVDKICGQVALHCKGSKETVEEKTEL